MHLSHFRTLFHQFLHSCTVLRIFPVPPSEFLPIRDEIRTRENPVIRQAISCDICGTEMQHTNHWFVAYDHGEELRLSGWNSRIRLRTGAKHLCGQTCLHKLVDDFMARTLAVRAPSAPAAKSLAPLKQQKSSRPEVASNDTSLTSPYSAAISHADPVTIAFADEFESSARIIPASAPARSVLGSPPSPRVPATAVPSTATANDEPFVENIPSYSSRAWRAEAWKREREREERAAHHPTDTPRRRSIA